MIVRSSTGQSLKNRQRERKFGGEKCGTIAHKSNAAPERRGRKVNQLLCGNNETQSREINGTASRAKEPQIFYIPPLVMTLSVSTTVVLTPASSGCSLLESPELGPRSFGCNAWDDDLSWESEYGLKKPGTPTNDCTVATAAITTALDTQGCVDLFGLGEEAKLASNDEEGILDDLLRLGLELGDLEDVFGNTDIDPSRSEEIKVVEEHQGDANGGEEASQSETVVYAGPDLVEDYAAEELLLAADLQGTVVTCPSPFLYSNCFPSGGVVFLHGRRPSDSRTTLVMHEAALIESS